MIMRIGIAVLLTLWIGACTWGYVPPVTKFDVLCPILQDFVDARSSGRAETAMQRAEDVRNVVDERAASAVDSAPETAPGEFDLLLGAAASRAASGDGDELAMIATGNCSDE